MAASFWHIQSGSPLEIHAFSTLYVSDGYGWKSPFGDTVTVHQVVIVTGKIADEV